MMASTLPQSQRRHRLSTKDYFRMGETGILGPGARIELLEGELIDMAPIGSVHAAAVAKLCQLFSAAAIGEVIVWPQNPVVLNDSNAPQPDIALLRFRQDYYRSAHPQPQDVLLLIEVSDTTLDDDLNYKTRLYAAAGIVEYWVVNVNTQSVIAMIEPIAGTYHQVNTLSGADVLAPKHLPSFTCTVSNIF